MTRKTTLLTLISLLFLLAVCIAPAAATSPYADLLQDPTRSTEDKLADFADALGWRDELGTYWMDMENYEMELAAQQAEIAQLREIKQTTAALGLDISDTVDTAIADVQLPTAPYTEEELAALDAESAAYYSAFAANYVATAAFSGSGSGTAEDPYIITNRAQIEAMADDLSAYYQLANDIDLGGSSSPWTSIGKSNAPFSGKLDGNGFQIANAYMTNQNHGVIGTATGTAIITRINFQNVYSDSAGAVNGITMGTGISSRPIVSYCTITGVFQSEADVYCVGRYVDVHDCWLDVEMIGVDDCGIASGNIYNVYALGSIDITNKYRNVGGIYGRGLAVSVSVSSCVALYDTITYSGSNTGNPSDSDTQGRVGGTDGSRQTYTNNYANANMQTSWTPTSNANGKDGADVSASTYHTQAFWETTLGWDFDTVWYWDDTVNLPKLQLSPVIKSASLSPAQSTVSNSIALSAEVLNYQVLQWQYQTLPGGYWQNISGATTLTYQWQPPQPGHYAVRLIATTDSGHVNSSNTLYCTQYGIAAPISPAASPDISPTTNYNPTSQYSLTDQVTELKYIGNNLSIWIAGNTTYLYNNGQNQPQALNPYVAGTITQANIAPDGSVSAITDWAMPIAITNGQNQPQALNLDNRTPIAITHNTDYIAVIYNTTDLIIYSATTGMPIANTTTTATKLSTNSNTKTIIGYNPTSTTITSYTISGSTINTKTATIPKTPVSITDVWGSEDIIITTTANTYQYTLDETGTITKTATSTETAPLINIDATSISTYIGSNTATLYIIDNTGTTIGTYTAGNTITITGIAHQSGLYAFASGNDNQVYFLSKSSSDDWVLNDVMPIGQTPTAGAVSFSGDQYLIASGTSVYTISLNSGGGGNVSAYYLNGIIIAASGAPYHGLFSVNGNQYQTDSAGKFVISVSPGTTYTITAGTTTTQYTATNVQYQTVAIKIQPDPYATNVDYSANWNSTTQAIDMTYNDKTGKTSSVTWRVRNTATNDVVFQQTTTNAQTLSYPIPAEQQYTNYQISMTADRTSTSGTQTGVSNTWMITPSGSDPIALPLDDTGKNILFTGVLMVFAALFGVMYSTKGAFAITALAAMMRYLELITIPWIVIVVAMAISILAALAKGSGGR